MSKQIERIEAAASEFVEAMNDAKEDDISVTINLPTADGGNVIHNGGKLGKPAIRAEEKIKYDRI